MEKLSAVSYRFLDADIRKKIVKKFHYVRFLSQKDFLLTCHMKAQR